MMSPVRFAVLFSISVTLLLGACGESREGEWQIQEGDLALTETLRLAEGDDFYFGEVFDVAVRDDGRIYVADGRAGQIKVLAADGTVRDTIGQRGEGPGDFRRAPTEVILAREDSLFVLDSYVAQVSVFTPAHAFARRFQIPRPTSNVLDLFVVDGESDFMARYSGYPVPGQPSREALRRIGPTGTPADTLFETPPRPQIVEEKNEKTRWGDIPFTPEPHFALGPDGTMHYGWGDSLRVSKYSTAGQQRAVTKIPFDPVPVTEDDREQRMDRNWQVSREMIRQKIPLTKPAFTSLLVDDEGRYWFGRPTPDPDTTAWWVALPEKKQVGTTTLPTDVLLMTVRNGHAYGRTTTDDGAPALVRYDVNLEL